MARLKRIVFTKTNTAEYLDRGEIDLENIGENQVAVKSYFTTVSAGTERANITASENTAPGENGKLFPR